MEKLDMVFAVGLAAMCSFGMWWGSDDGILHAPSGEAVLMLGEACMVNMGANRPLTHIRTDFDFCIDQHARIFFGDEE